MKTLLNWLRARSFHRKLARYRKTVNSSVQTVFGFLPITVLEENFLYRRETSVPMKPYISKDCPLQLLLIKSIFAADKNIYAWGCRFQDGYMAIPLGTKQVVFVNMLLHQIEEVKDGQDFAVKIDQSGSNVFFKASEQDITATHIEDTFGKKSYVFRIGRQPCWERICLYAN